ncbi:hypothetical protein D5086_014283 [Populus alba]|uniref:Uncharacterized protein n=1 Tax=Populus alba TaxID=43335 RepID=A0ACC4BYI2_POPAL
MEKPSSTFPLENSPWPSHCPTSSQQRSVYRSSPHIYKPGINFTNGVNFASAGAGVFPVANLSGTNLYNLGARKIAILNVGPRGCQPAARQSKDSVVMNVMTVSMEMIKKA